MASLAKVFGEFRVMGRPHEELTPNTKRSEGTTNPVKG